MMTIYVVASSRVEWASDHPTAGISNVELMLFAIVSGEVAESTQLAEGANIRLKDLTADKVAYTDDYGYALYVSSYSILDGKVLLGEATKYLLNKQEPKIFGGVDLGKGFAELIVSEETLDSEWLVGNLDLATGKEAGNTQEIPLRDDIWDDKWFAGRFGESLVAQSNLAEVFVVEARAAKIYGLLLPGESDPIEVPYYPEVLARIEED